MSELNLKITQRHAELLRTACLRHAAHIGSSSKRTTLEVLVQEDEDIRLLAEMETLLDGQTLRAAANAKSVMVRKSAGLNDSKARYLIVSPITSMRTVIDARNLKVDYAMERLGAIGLTYEQAGKVLCLIGSANKSDAARWLSLDYAVSSDV